MVGPPRILSMICGSRATPIEMAKPRQLQLCGRTLFRRSAAPTKSAPLVFSKVLISSHNVKNALTRLLIGFDTWDYKDPAPQPTRVNGIGSRLGRESLTSQIGIERMRLKNPLISNNLSPAFHCEIKIREEDDSIRPRYSECIRQYF